MRFQMISKKTNKDIGRRPVDLYIQVELEARASKKNGESSN